MRNSQKADFAVGEMIDHVNRGWKITEEYLHDIQKKYKCNMAVLRAALTIIEK